MRYTTSVGRGHSGGVTPLAFHEVPQWPYATHVRGVEYVRLFDDVYVTPNGCRFDVTYSATGRSALTCQYPSQQAHAPSVCVPPPPEGKIPSALDLYGTELISQALLELRSKSQTAAAIDLRLPDSHFNKLALSFAFHLQPGRSQTTVRADRISRFYLYTNSRVQLLTAFSGKGEHMCVLCSRALLGKYGTTCQHRELAAFTEMAAEASW